MTSSRFARTQALEPHEFEALTSLWKAPGLIATLISVFCAFGGWSLLLPVIPFAVIQSGGGDSLAGLSTGVFMATTVCTQALTPWLIRRVGFTVIMAGAGVLLGLPALVYAVDMSPVPLLTVAAARGVGFGAVTVAEAALIAELVPPRLMGHSSAALGVAVGSSQLVSFPLGLWMQAHVGVGWVFVLAAVYASVGALAAWWIPPLGVSRSSTPTGVDKADSATSAEASSVPAISGPAAQPVAATWKLAVVPGLAIGACATGFAAFSTFLAPAVEVIDVEVASIVAAVGLSVMGGLQMLGRVIAGRFASARGRAGGLAAWGLVLSIAGLMLAGCAIAFEPRGAGLVAMALGASGVFGFGFGVVQNEALLMLFQRLPREKTTLASALWNMTFDSGTGAGAVVLGMLASAVAYNGAFFAAAGLVVLACAAVCLDAFLGRHRRWESDNVAHSLRALTQRVRGSAVERAD